VGCLKSLSHAEVLCGGYVIPSVSRANGAVVVASAIIRSKENHMKFIQMAKRRLSTVGELLSFFVRNKRWWMLPTVLVVLVLGVLLILAQSSVIAPFIYTLF
jgi:hypothetical protein